MGKDVRKSVKEFFDMGNMLKEINSTLITLIHKIETPDKVTHFRPIACCNVIYKCIRYDKKEGPRRVAMKIDIQKAYDTVSWKFLEDILKDDLLMFCYGDKGSVKTLKEAIEEFGYVSGLKPNYDKSTIIFGSIKEEDRQDILECVPFKAVNEEIYDSSGWKSMLRLRDEVRNFIVIRIRNGEKAYVIYNNWCGTGALQSFITHRDLYNVRWHDRMAVKDIVENGICVWLEEWTKKYPDLAMNNKVMINNEKEDEILWRLKNRKEDKFSIIRVYQDLCDNDGDVKWHKIIWFSQNIPEHSFILWMAVQNKLITQDKIKKWGSFDMMACPLCRKDMDSHHHLFFQCEYAASCNVIMLLWLQDEWCFLDLDVGNVVRNGDVREVVLVSDLLV
uniref:Reverse transcriptase zinc-binding domain-containing protein n=1 Tax=Tanacetum cinerariifolium TaxID=118510 RepID=A0A6L2L8P0_TANCI|nr:hypothetical protein [Tanacetum cinerariifolium]